MTWPRGTAELESKIESLVKLLSATQDTDLGHAEDYRVSGNLQVNLPRVGNVRNGPAGEISPSEHTSVSTSLLGGTLAPTQEIASRTFLS
jgi:hypothetical protein